MHSAKGGGKDDRGPPESDAAGQRVLEVSAEEGFFEDPGSKKDESPTQGEFPRKPARQMITVKCQQMRLP